MASREEVRHVGATMRANGVNVAVADSANYFANPIESMFTRESGPRADVLLLQCTDHNLPHTLAVMRVNHLQELLTTVEAARMVLARGG